MSDKNRDGKRTARERLREERERDEARARRKRGALVGGGIVAVLAIAAVIGVVVAGRGGGQQGAPAAAPSGATGKADLAVPVGDPNAPSTLTVYEDFRCPACDGFERSFRATVHSLMDSGKLKGEYHLVRLIDGNLGGTGSLHAANAAACAQEEGRFRPYHDLLYDNQPDEREDSFADNKRLLQLAAKVPGMKTAAFTSCVDSGRYDAWVNKANAQFARAGFGSTPTVLLNGKNIYADTAHPLSPARLIQLVDAADQGKPLGSAAPTASTGSSASTGGSAPAGSSATAGTSASTGGSASRGGSAPAGGSAAAGTAPGGSGPSAG
ncbi:DsbA family protein [Streptantibioticus silvisoli]|uniref:DsbA family protein n=1 Tax=Streptantibioticus silvisoli TaxID=2705255 RepID=UPI0027E31EA6|nr:thioredoxin domain-containing protein [Streptantibioticus silvisoli]